jgi:uncharacterized membrane protein
MVGVSSLNSLKRPDINLPLTLKDKVLILIATLPIIFMLVYLKIIWSDIPDIIPTHFGFSGTPDDFGSKKSLFIIIIISISLHMLFAFLSKMPQYYNYPVSVTDGNAETLYRIGRQLILVTDLEVSIFLSALIWENIQAALGKIYGVSEIIFPFIGLILFTIIYEVIRMNKVR